MQVYAIDVGERIMPQEYIMQQALDAWGEDRQLDMVIEECSELIKAILKYRRSEDKIAARQHIAEEHADVNIMLDQLAFMMEKHDISGVIPYRKLKFEHTREKVVRLTNTLDAIETMKALDSHSKPISGSRDKIIFNPIKHVDGC